LTPEGKVKVLDFGLAKAFECDATNDDMSNSPTLSRAATMQGVILGTAAYMSPEQARGKAVDKRTDIWAFGCVFYELLTGKAAFHGEDITDILAAVVRAEPDWQALPASTPVKIRDLLHRCLRKDVNRRARDAGDVRIEMEESLAAPATAEAVNPVKGIRALGRRALLFGLGALLVGATIASLAVWNLKPSPPQRVTRTVINLPPGQQLAVFKNDSAVAISPDSALLAYIAIQSGTQQIYLRAMDSLEARPIAGTEGAIDPFFSPDGHWLGFFAGGKLKKVSVSGGAALTLGDAVQPRGASWGSRDTIAFAPTGASALQQVPDAGGAPQPLTLFEKGEGSHRWPDFLPGGKAVLFATGSDGGQIAVLSMETGERRNIAAGGYPQYAQSGHLIYTQAGTLMAVPFNAERLTATGTAVPVVEGVLQSAVNGVAQYSISATGSLVYIPGGTQGDQRRLVWVNRTGTEAPLAAPGGSYEAPRVSPDGRRIAMSIQGQETQIWLYDLSREALSRLTFQGKLNADPTWTPDGKRIAFYSNMEGPVNLYWQLADGSGGPQRLTTSDYFQNPNSWSPDGQLLAYHEVNPTTQRDIWVLRLKDRKTEPFLRTPADESAPRFSPDGRWLTYVSNESGRFEIYVQPYPGPGGKWQISTNGGTEPVWNPNGHELFYRNGDKMMAVDISSQPGFSAGKPRMLFEGHYLPTTVGQPDYDVSPDGQRFLMVKPTEQAQAAPTQINVVLNWFEELKQKVPTGKK
jgi:eukaryotic-like serine/threonine-protein kinase